MQGHLCSCSLSSSCGQREKGTARNIESYTENAWNSAKFTSESFVTSYSLSHSPSLSAFCFLLVSSGAVLFPLLARKISETKLSYCLPCGCYQCSLVKMILYLRVLFPLIIEWQNCSLQGKIALFHYGKLEYLPQDHCLTYWWRYLCIIFIYISVLRYCSI